ncbi:MAG: hypothetical protein H7258_13635 [Ferruginibacter sp.]|nr:hypothetical protein [Ferruginibacter sp.]
MKKICFMILLGCSSMMVQAQDLDNVKEMINKSQFKEARVIIDKYLAQPKNAGEAEAWYYKGRIYNGLSLDKANADSVIYSLKSESFDAFKKEQSLDPKDIYLLVEGYASYLDLYVGLYDFGAKQFNAKNYGIAYQAFKKANEVKDYTLDKKYSYTQVTLYPLDTALVLNTAVAATQAKKIEEGIAFYKKLTDAGVSGKDYENVYEYLVDYYTKKDDQAALQPIFAKAKKLYPTNPFWNDVELRAIAAKGDNNALYAKYDEMLAKDPNNYDLAYGYAVELYNSLIKKDDKTKANPAELEKLQSVLKIAIAADKGIDATVLMTNHLFNRSADLLSAANLIKSTKPEEIKKKTELKAKANASMDETITYADAAIKYFEAQTTLKPVQKANYSIILDHLSEMYDVKNNPKKVAEFDAKKKVVDKL